MNRRIFVRNTSLATAAFSILPAANLFAQTRNVRLGFIGVGLRGQNHLDLALRRKDCEVIAICDINERMLESATGMIKKSG
ncbi:hypothetical protein QQ054_12320 [Oscillatoria amoena NRMC-F 0135]|nr:hypothetical protein [Oscillatoria amoena NRMC-F 0135]